MDKRRYKFIPKQAIIEALWIISMAAVIGFTVNQIHPQGVQITSVRPPIEYAADSVFAHNLPPAEIQIDQTPKNSEEQIFEEPIVINTKQVRQLIADDMALLLDARCEEEYLKSHIQNSQNLPFENLMEYENELKSLPFDKWLICYCDGPPCDLGELLAYELVNMGYKKVAIYLEGLNGWKSSGKALGGEKK